jgi:ABC-type glycerol-3-phosphate transport system substrate-binding protein
MKPVTRRHAVRSAYALAAAGAAACGPQPGTAGPEPSQGPVTVRAFIGGIDAATADRWESEIAGPYRQRRANVAIELVSQTSVAPSGATAEVMEKLTALIAGGDPPDITDLPRPATQLVPLGFLDESLDRLVRRDRFDTKQFNQHEFERRAVYQGKVWQIPYKYLSNALVVVCNQHLFQAGNVAIPSADRPWEWSAFVDALIKLTKRAGGATSQFGLLNWGSQTYTWPLLWQTDWVSADGRTATCDSAEMLDCYTRWAELFHRHNVIPRPGETRDLFGTTSTPQLFFAGKGAMVIMSPGTWRTYITRGELAEIALAPMPKFKVSTADVATTDLGIARGSKRPADAWEVIKYFSEGSRLARYANYLPAIAKDIEPWAREDVKRFPAVDVRVVLRAIETHAPNSRLSGHPKQDEILRVTGPALDGLLEGKEAPVPLLRRLKPELQAIIDRT